MRFQAELSVNALQELERLIDKPDTQVGSPAFVRVMAAVDRIVGVLERHVVRYDEFGFDVVNEEELILRAARLVIATHLDGLDRAFRSVSVIAPPMSERDSSWSRFLEVLPLAKAELGRITSLWLAHRRLEPASTGMAAEVSPYVGALRQVCDELHAMEQIPAVERMLYRGVASVRRDIAAPCEQTIIAMRVRIDLSPARRQWLAHTRWARTARSVAR
jgi:hypothetical protein